MSSPRLVNFGTGGAKILKGVKNCNAFLVHCLTERDEIGHCYRSGQLTLIS